MATTFFLSKNVDRSLELLVRFDNTRVSNYHTTLDFFLVDTTEQQTYVVTSFTCRKSLTEHLNTCYNRLLVFAKTEQLNFVTNLNDTSLNTTSSNSTTTSDREHVLNRHQEWLISITNRIQNPFVNCIHQLLNAVYPLLNAVQSTEGRTTNDRSILFVAIFLKKLLHIHFYEFEHLFILNHIALVQEHNQTRNVHLTSEQDVLTSLRHRTISCSNYDDCTVHLSSTSYHVLHIVGVTRTVNVSIVTLCSLVLNMSGIDSNTTLFLFRSVVNLIERLNVFATVTSVMKNLRNSSSQSGLTVIDVTNSTDVNMRLGTLKYFFSHSFI